MKLIFSDIRMLPNSPGYSNFAASAKFDRDISSLFPYIKAVVEKGICNEKPLFIRFIFKQYLCILYPENVVIAPVRNMKDAVSALEAVIGYITDINERRSEITPDFTRFWHQPVLDIYRLLPRTNCGECGFENCMAFAAAVSLRKCPPEKCPFMGTPLYEKAVYPVYDNNGNLVTTVEVEIKSGNRKSKRLKGTVHQQATRIPIDRDLSLNSDLVNTDVLSRRQVEVLKLISEGYSNREISALLSVSINTIKSHIIQIFNKLGVHDRTQASVLAIRKKIM